MPNDVWSWVCRKSWFRTTSGVSSFLSSKTSRIRCLSDSSRMSLMPGIFLSLQVRHGDCQLGLIDQVWQLVHHNALVSFPAASSISTFARTGPTLCRCCTPR